jgi:glycosyltransferase involved in cell wall biosynthesis
MMKKRISVIIPSYNSGRTIERAFRALDAQTAGDLVSEIVVVDSSDDGRTKELLSRYGPGKIRVMDAGVKVMPAVSRNMGAERASGEILVFLDADAYPAPDWLENIVKACEEGYAAGGGCVELPDFQKGDPVVRAHYYLEFNEYMCCGNRRVKSFVPACNMFCDRDLFRKVGGFPEIRAAEDVLFGLTAGRHAQVVFLPEAKVYHVFGESWGRFLENQRLLGRYACVYRKRYYDNLLYKGIMPLVLFPVFLCVKSLRIMFRIFQAGPYHAYHFFVTVPVILPGLLFWGIGFIEGARAGRTRNRDAG